MADSDKRSFLESFANPIGSALGGVFGLASTLLTNQANAAQADKQMSFQAAQAQSQNEFNRQMMHEQNEWNLQQWNRENAWNSPDAQLQRLHDAGINPLFSGLDGTGNASALTSATASAAGLPSGAMVQMANPVGSVTEMMKAFSDMALQAAQKRNVEEGTKGQQIQNDINSAVGMDTALATLNKIKVDTSLDHALRRKYEDEAAFIELQKEKYPEITDAEIALKMSQYDLNRNQADVAQATYEKIMKENTWIDRMSAASVANYMASANLSRKELESYDFVHMKTVTASEAMSMGINIAKFGINGSKFDSTPIIIVPDSSEKSGFRAVGVSLSGTSDIPSQDSSKPSAVEAVESLGSAKSFHH